MVGVRCRLIVSFGQYVGGVWTSSTLQIIILGVLDIDLSVNGYGYETVNNRLVLQCFLYFGDSTYFKWKIFLWVPSLCFTELFQFRLVLPHAQYSSYLCISALDSPVHIGCFNKVLIGRAKTTYFQGRLPNDFL